jgi:hypothetical protein
VTSRVRGKTEVTLAFRLLEKKGVSHFGVRWGLRELDAENLKLAADLTQPAKWKVCKKGAFETGFGAVAKPGQKRFHIPFISMPAGSASEFRHRHGDPATPERIAGQVGLSLQAWQDGKCDGVVTYCLDKRPKSSVFPLVKKLFREYGKKSPGPGAKPGKE